MRSRDEHLKQANDNEALGERLLLSGDLVSTSWAATLFFYSAVHYGRAFLAARDVTKLSTHVGFETLFQRKWNRSSAIFHHYRSLKFQSERARYDCAAYSSNEVRDLRDHHLYPFRDAILAALGSP